MKSYKHNNVGIFVIVFGFFITDLEPPKRLAMGTTVLISLGYKIVNMDALMCISTNFIGCF